MDIHFQNPSGEGWRADCALVFVFEKERPASFAPLLWELCPWLESSPALRDFTGRKDDLTLVYGLPELPISRVILVGLGKKDAFSLSVFRIAVAKAVHYCRGRGFATLGLPVEALDALLLNRGILIREAVVASKLCLYRCDTYRSAKDENETPPDPRWLGLLFAEEHIPEESQQAARQGEAEAAGVALARELSNGPANHITPAVLAEEAQRLGKAHGFACTVLSGEEIRRLGMGALWAVARGARQEPRFIVLEHCPKGREKENPLVLAGKGVTFDTGGISLKPAAKMHEMKGDMGGAAAVLGLFAAIGAMPKADALPRIVGLVAAAENMPGSDASRPGDVVATLSGKTVEILNTDAEGRLILCDALTYAQQHWSPVALIDVATLTGACVVALGDHGSGLFTQDKGLRSAFMDAAALTGDLLWPMPLWDEYDANLKSDIADVANIGAREGGAINAALFLRRFVEKGVRWVHLDIAGPGYVVKASPLHPVPGGTGAGVRLLCRFLENPAAFADEQQEGIC
ncbi:MAG: leucyl aminopeptidase [Desulfovibrio sp.]|jgi:leucyl aminopeptidase|nr:leucyl aminopeptidase [Desulfovibrio sp.]